MTWLQSIRTGNLVDDFGQPIPLVVSKIRMDEGDRSLMRTGSLGPLLEADQVADGIEMKIRPSS